MSMGLAPAMYFVPETRPRTRPERSAVAQADILVQSLLGGLRPTYLF